MAASNTFPLSSSLKPPSSGNAPEAGIAVREMRMQRMTPDMYRLGAEDALLQKFDLVMNVLEGRQRCAYLPLFAEHALDISNSDLEGEEKIIADVEPGVVRNIFSPCDCCILAGFALIHLPTEQYHRSRWVSALTAPQIFLADVCRGGEAAV